VPERAFPVIYAEDVGRSLRFYEELGFEEHFRLPSDGEPGYVGLRRGDWELAVVTAQSPQQLIGVEIGSKPRFEMFVYVADVDRQVAQLRGAGVSVLREAEDMFWGERVAWVADPDGNPVALAAGAGQD
jgi:lactoylglutathione lyase